MSLLHPGVPLIGAKPMSSAWWRYLRALQAQADSNTTKIATNTTNIATNTADIDTLEGVSILDGELIQGVTFTADVSKAVTHTLGRTPVGSLLTRIDLGTLPSVTGAMPARNPTKHSYESFSSGSSSYAHTCLFTPTDGYGLVLGIVLEQYSRQVSSITQSGVTWTNIGRQVGGTSFNTELWLGHTVASASTSMTITLDSTSSASLAISIVEFAELSATAARNSAVADLGANLNIYSDDSVTPPTAIQGDLCITALGCSASSTLESLQTNGWDLEGIARASGGEGIYMMARVAGQDGAYPLRGYGKGNRKSIVQGTFATTLAGGAATSIPVGLIETARDTTTITVLPSATFDGDLWVF